MRFGFVRISLAAIALLAACTNDHASRDDEVAATTTTALAVPMTGRRVAGLIELSARMPFTRIPSTAALRRAGEIILTVTALDNPTAQGIDLSVGAARADDQEAVAIGRVSPFPPDRAPTSFRLPIDSEARAALAADDSAIVVAVSAVDASRALDPAIRLAVDITVGE